MTVRMLICLALVLGGCSHHIPNPHPTIVLMGDSITHLWEPMLSEVLPEALDVGINSQTSAQMLTRFDRDVIAYHPKTVVILAGVNDLLMTDHPTVDSIAAMAHRARDAGIRVILCTLPPIEGWHPAYKIHDAVTGDPALARFNAAIWALAKAEHYEVVDYHTAMLKGGDALFRRDRIHPNKSGFKVMWHSLQEGLTDSPH